MMDIKKRILDIKTKIHVDTDTITMKRASL